MVEILRTYVIPTLVGISVAAVAYLLFGDWERQGSVSQHYRYVEYSSDFFNSDRDMIDSLFSYIEEEQNKSNELADSVKATLADFLDGFDQFHTLGLYGYIEQIEIENQESRKSMSVRVEGRDIDYTVIDYRGKTDELHTKNFDTVIELLPGENLSIINVQRRATKYRYSDNESDSIFLSVDGKCIKPDNRSTIVNDIFGRVFVDYPFLFLISFLFGLIAFLIVIAEVVTRLVPSLRKRIVLQNSDKELAVFSNALRFLKEKNPERFGRIQNFASDDTVFRFEDDNQSI